MHAIKEELMKITYKDFFSNINAINKTKRTYSIQLTSLCHTVEGVPVGP